MPGSAGHSWTAAGSRPRPRAAAGAGRAGARARSGAPASVIVRLPANTRRCRHASSPVSSTTAMTSRLGDANLDATAGEARDRASSRCDRPARYGCWRHAHHRTADRSRASGAGSGRIRSRSSSSRSTGTARIVRCTRRLAWSHQRVELQLEVEMVREPPARLEVRAHEPVRALQRALRLRIPGIAGSPSRPPAARRTPANSTVGRPPPAIAPSRSHTSFSGNAPIRHRQRADAPQDVRRLLAEHQRAGDHPRPAQLRRHDPPRRG